MPFDPRTAQQVQNLLAARVPLADAYRITGVSQADRVYYGLNNQGTVIPTAVPPPAQIQVNNLQAEVTATQDRIAALRQVVDDPNATRTARAAAQVNITRQETALADYRRELTAAQAQVAQQTVVPTAVRAAPAAQPTPAPEPPATSLIPPGYRGVVTNADGEVIGYTLPGGEIEWVPGSEPVEEYEPQDQPDPYANGEDPDQEQVEVTEPEPVPTFQTDDLPENSSEQVARLLAAPEPVPTFQTDDLPENSSEQVANLLAAPEPVPTFQTDDLPENSSEQVARLLAAPPPVPGGDDGGEKEPETPDFGAAIDQEDADMGQAMRESLRLQGTSAQRAGNNAGYDWRVKISLAPGANYLYADTSNSLLSCLNSTQGVIFPYTPTISTSYVAQYDQTDLTHSNYRGYFYKNSRVEQVTVNGTFTAQNTPEANYLLAVIHFFRSVTKMFYGQDKERGTPPPIVYLTGYGEFQFQRHPCLVSNFSYNLPNGVDYIRTQPVNLNNTLGNDSSAPKNATFAQILGGLGLQPQLDRLGTLTDLLSGKKLSRDKGGPANDLNINVVNSTTQATYVPTKMEIQVSLLPLQSRKQISQEFSLKEFANGNLLKKGFW